MGKVTEWKGQIDGSDYEFSYEKKKGKNIITANGVPIEVKGSFMSSILGFDEPFNLNGKEVRLVIERNQPDIVANGVYLKSGKQYIPRPGWVLVFAIICIAMPIVNLGGAVPALLAVLGIFGCVKVSKTLLPVAVRILLCILITAAVWVGWAAIAIGISSL